MSLKLRFTALLLLLVFVLSGCVDKTPTQSSPSADVLDSAVVSEGNGKEEGVGVDINGESSGNESTQSSAPQPEKSEIALHFLDVGQADAILVICDGKAMLIDGGNREDSSLLYTYLKKQGISHLSYIIATHAHEDHVGGLPGALNYATVDKVYCPVTAYESDAFKNFAKYVEKAGVALTVPKAGESFALGSAMVQIIGVNSAAGTNNSSIVTKITHGNTSFLFTGDAEREAEQAILESGCDLSSTLLKVGHHGSDSSTTYPFLREIMPEYAVISVGVGNVYGHPHDVTLSRLEDADVTVYRTDVLGTVVCKGNGKTLSFEFPDKGNTVDNSSLADDSVGAETSYILNTSSKKFHYPDCESAGKISEKNKSEHQGNREELIAKGYTPCGICHP